VLSNTGRGGGTLASLIRAGKGGGSHTKKPEDTSVPSRCVTTDGQRAGGQARKKTHRILNNSTPRAAGMPKLRVARAKVPRRNEPGDDRSFGAV